MVVCKEVTEVPLLVVAKEDTVDHLQHCKEVMEVPLQVTKEVTEVPLQVIREVTEVPPLVVAREDTETEPQM